MSGNIHLIGIRGAGMCALARWYQSLGWNVTGCDRSSQDNPSLDGIAVAEGHSRSHLDGQDAVVFTAAMADDCPEVLEARKRGIRTLRRSEALGELTRGCSTMAVAGAHGKTSTTSMTGWILQEVGMNPTVFLGGGMTPWGGNFRPGGPLAVVEADEYDRAFLRITSAHAAVTSFDLEHLECYGSSEALEWAFEVFLELTLPGGTVVVPAEKPSLGRYAARIGRRVVVCGPSGDCHLMPMESSGWGMDFSLEGVPGRLPAPGVHNLRNAETAVALCGAAGVEPKDAVEALSTWPGVQRRLERIGETRGTVLISDYAHHPREIAAAISAVKQAIKGSVDVVFQPHLFSRTGSMFREMAHALLPAENVWVLPIYPSREQPVEGVTSELITRESGGRFQEVCEERLTEVVRGSSAGAILFMGAGSVDEMARRTMGELK